MKLHEWQTVQTSGTGNVDAPWRDHLVNEAIGRLLSGPVTEESFAGLERDELIAAKLRLDADVRAVKEAVALAKANAFRGEQRSPSTWYQSARKSLDRCMGASQLMQRCIADSDRKRRHSDHAQRMTEERDEAKKSAIVLAQEVSRLQAELSAARASAQPSHKNDLAVAFMEICRIALAEGTFARLLERAKERIGAGARA